MFNVQCAILIATGPLCGLHDCIKNDSAPLYEEIKVAFEQVLCLLGSASAQMSILKRTTESPRSHKPFDDKPRGTTSA